MARIIAQTLEIGKTGLCRVKLVTHSQTATAVTLQGRAAL
jgi:hypothetical protein